MEKDSVIGPVAYSLIGAGVGISTGMIHCQSGSSYGRVPLEVGVPLAVGGAVAGALFGCGVAAVYHSTGRFRPAIRVLTTMFLWVAIGAPIGWLTGDMRSTNYVTHERLTRLGMTFGSIAGAVTGLMSGLWVEWRRNRQPERE